MYLNITHLAQEKRHLLSFCCQSSETELTYWLVLFVSFDLNSHIFFCVSLSWKCSLRNTCTWTMRSATSWTVKRTLMWGTSRTDGSASTCARGTWSLCRPASTTASPWTRPYVFYIVIDVKLCLLKKESSSLFWLTWEVWIQHWLCEQCVWAHCIR